MDLIKLRTPHEKRRTGRVPLTSEQSLRELLSKYWPWHYDDTLEEVARLLFSNDLGWEPVRLLTPPAGEVISPLGRAFEYPDDAIQEAALRVLDSMAVIPAGEVYIGEDLMQLHVNQFQLGRYPVTNAQYHRFVRQTGHRAPPNWDNARYPESKGDHPVTHVSCADAEAYAAWAGARLPTFEEWERAVRGDDGRLFPWGDEIDRPRCNTAELGAGGTTPVGAFPEGVSPFGCYDMLGNVWEWTSTWYDEAEQYFRVVRGGAWYYNHDQSTCVSYEFFSKDYADFVIGFRIAR